MEPEPEPEPEPPVGFRCERGIVCASLVPWGPLPSRSRSRSRPRSRSRSRSRMESALARVTGEGELLAIGELLPTLRWMTYNPFVVSHMVFAIVVDTIWGVWVRDCVLIETSLTNC